MEKELKERNEGEEEEEKACWKGKSSENGEKFGAGEERGQKKDKKKEEEEKA